VYKNNCVDKYYPCIATTTVGTVPLNRPSLAQHDILLLKEKWIGHAAIRIFPAIIDNPFSDGIIHNILRDFLDGFIMSDNVIIKVFLPKRS
jgi:hypothetical protein